MIDGSLNDCISKKTIITLVVASCMFGALATAAGVMFFASDDRIDLARFCDFVSVDGDKITMTCKGWISP